MLLYECLRRSRAFIALAMKVRVSIIEDGGEGSTLLNLVLIPTTPPSFLPSLTVYEKHDIHSVAFVSCADHPSKSVGVALGLGIKDASVFILGDEPGNRVGSSWISGSRSSVRIRQYS